MLDHISEVELVSKGLDSLPRGSLGGTAIGACKGQADLQKAWKKRMGHQWGPIWQDHP